MTTQATICTLMSKKGDYAIEFLKTATDDAWNEMVDVVNSLSLHKVIPHGTTIDRLRGSYTLGCGCIRVRNTGTNEVKAIEPLDKVTGEQMHRFYRPFTVQLNDVLEVFVTAENS